MRKWLTGSAVREMRRFYPEIDHAEDFTPQSMSGVIEHRDLLLDDREQLLRLVEGIPDMAEYMDRLGVVMDSHLLDEARACLKAQEE